MALPDKHQLKFNSYKDAKTLMEAIEKHFGGNTKTKKVQKTLLKQQFENFTGSSSKDLDQIHDRLQKLVSQLEIHRVSLSQEDVNLKFLRSLPSEWKTHTLIWRNKANLEEHISAATSVSAGYAQLHVAFYLNINFLSNAVIFLFFASQSTSPQLDNEDLKQINVDDLKEMDLRWQMAMLTMRARIFLQKTGRNLGDNKVTTMGFDMSKVECYNCHRKGHFARECRSPKDTRRTGTAELHRRHVLFETSTSNDLVSQCDGIRSYDWSYQAEDEPANFALMAISSSSYAFDNETSSKSLTELLANQTNSKHGLGYYSESDSKSLSPSSLSDRVQPSGEYHVVSPPITGNFMSPKPDLVFHTSFIAIESAHSTFTVQLSLAKSAQDISHVTRPMAPIIEDWVSDSEDESEPNNPQSVPSFIQTTEHVKPSGHSDQPVETPILAATPKPTSPKTNCSSKRKNRKTCFVCRSVDHLIKDCHFYDKSKTSLTPRNYAHRGYNKQDASFTKNHPQKHIVPTAVLPKSKPVSVTAARPVSVVVPKIMVSKPRHAYSLNTKSNSIIKRHKTRSQFSKTSNSSPKVTAAKAQVVSAAKGKKGKWGNPQYALKDKGVIDSGCSRHMIGNMSYLSDFQELNGGYVAFDGNPKGGKISGKGKIKTGKLDFEDVYFVKELKFNLFSVSQMCDKKNKVLFIDSKCLVLSPDFQLPDESQVLLRVPRENNMYNVNLKDIVHYGDLTCLFTKAIIDESNLWHRRLGHEDVNLKFLRSLPSEWKTHTLIWRNKANLEEHSLDDFTTDSVSAATSVSAVCAQLLVSSHPNIDSLKMDLRWQMAMLTMRVRRFLQKTGRNLGDNRATTMGFDMSKVECYNCHRKGHFARECSYDWSYQAEEEPANFALMAISSTSSSDNEVQSCSTACSKAYKQLHSQYDSQTAEICKSKIDVLSYQAALESVESRLVVYKQNESIFQDNIVVLKNEVAARDNFISNLKQKLKEAETERDDLKLKFEKFQSSSKSLAKLIASQTNNKYGLGYLPSEGDSASLSLSCPSDMVQPSGGYNVVPPSITGNFMPPKPNLVFNTAPLVVESDHSAFNVQLSPAKPAQTMSHTIESMAPIIEDWVSESEDESEPNDPQSAPSFV
nr:ribonuclease H-like domain-containing protein [Tanacetum cinerariifolium]